MISRITRFILLFGHGLAVASLAPAATFTVTNLGDAASGGTLRWAITAANTSPAPPHVITFNVPSPFTITPTGGLPSVSSTGLLINGASQPGYTGTPIVHLVGTSSPALFGLSLVGSNITVRALRVSSFPTFSSGIRSFGPANRIIACTLENNQVGVELLSPARANIIGGSAASNGNRMILNRYAGILSTSTGGQHLVQGNLILSNGTHGIDWQSPFSTIGGNTSAGERNIISANTNGLYLNQSSAYSVGVYGNYIGTDETGTNTLPNFLDGINVLGASNCMIGGTALLERNVISGNGRHGIRINFGNGHEIVGNYIGINATGNRMGNGGLDPNGSGIAIEAGEFNTILGNVISGNGRHGISLSSTNTFGTGIYGNFIGTTASGLGPMSNHVHGIAISNARSNIIGSALFRNVISANAQFGVSISGTNAGPTLLQNNFIGPGNNGTLMLFNGRGGVLITNTRNVEIGSITAGPSGGNLISGNAFAGILIDHPACENIFIQHNWIGPDVSGTNLLSNTASGIDVRSANTNILIGVHGRNLISGNQANGVTIRQAQQVVVANNFIGVASNGTAALRNMGDGITITGAVASATITNNTISGNVQNGIHVADRAGSTIVIAGNRIGVNSAGTAVVSNRVNGVRLFKPDDVLIGGITASDRNIISGNEESGISVEYATNGAVTISGNSIGVNAGGVTPLPNRHNGITVQFTQSPDNVTDVTIGGPLASYGNYISGNISNGVLVSVSRYVSIANNRIGIDPGGGIGTSNRSAGIRITTSSLTNFIISNHIANNGGPGIELLDGVRETLIQNNTIGVGNTPLSPRGNNGPGIFIENSARSLIGGSWPEGNRIGFNNGPGIAITSILFASHRSQHEIYGNAVYGNVGLPIDLLYDGVTTNDPAPDADFGWPNELQNFPVLNVVRRGNAIWLYSTFVSHPAFTYRIEYFASSPATGMEYIGFTNVVLPPSGTGVFAHAFNPVVPIATGAVVWATASTTNFGTSEFSSGLSLLENLTDSDNDKMPNWWEILYLFNPFTSNAPGANADADDYTDLEEWIAFTDPRDPQSFPRITAIAQSAGDRLVTFPSSDERVYRLARTTDPATNPSWSAVSGVITGQFGATTIPDTNAPNVHAYRVEVRLP